MEKQTLLHVLLAVLILEFGYIFLNYERTTEGGIRIMLPNAFLVIGCLVITGGIGVSYLLKTANQADLPNLRPATEEEKIKLKIIIPVVHTTTDNLELELPKKPFYTKEQRELLKSITEDAEKSIY